MTTPSEPVSLDASAAPVEAPPAQSAPAAQNQPAPPLLAQSDSDTSTLEAQADDSRSDTGDSALGSEYDESTYTASLTSSITAYQYEHGRRYHAYQAGRYILPNDEQEQERMDLQYHAFRLGMGDKLYQAPIGADAKAILDIGTGTGIWAIDCADVHPEAEIVGTDLSPIQPQWVPPNVKFEVDDCEQPWTFAENRFDLIHTRILMGSIRNWEGLMEQAFKHNKPGGWVELQEMTVMVGTDDNSIPENAYIKRWCDNQEEAVSKIGMSLLMGSEKLREAVEKAGYTNITVREFKIPIGTWPMDPKMRETGAFQLVAMLDGIQGLMMALWTRFLGWSEQEIEVFAAEARKEWRSRKVHSYWPLHCIYAQKPLTAAS
ncbi:uncharacterized protein KY384_005059 [Bacidia gigantensis]|uniref:uncharacterized protein n=1 Tax=Bacidia gigantensis TaxID=2732470 RepID=UPI001D058343|nr:uncharacterized protein KY384_005059 [Bacidia gigantensis]KAG8530556.1 hypothetical protein KY384_005059 [Bacidia gigantensis]